VLNYDSHPIESRTATVLAAGEWAFR